MRGRGEFAHLVRRGLWSLRSRQLDAADQAWVAERLSPAEQNLWDRLSGNDQVHSLTVARTVVSRRPDAPDVILVAALLHDVGKGVAGAGVVIRVLATLVESRIEPERVAQLAWTSGWRGRLGAYLRYPELGAQMLTEGGSDPWVVAWSREHHLPAHDWSIPAEWAQLLADADRAAGC